LSVKLIVGFIVIDRTKEKKESRQSFPPESLTAYHPHKQLRSLVRGSYWLILSGPRLGCHAGEPAKKKKPEEENRKNKQETLGGLEQLRRSAGRRA
jgi:hypothetical protein